MQDPQNKLIDQATKDLIDKLILERLSLAGIARVTGVSELWLQRYVNAKYVTVPRRVSVSAKKRGD
ncbi:transposase, IS1 family [Leptolyngbya boryana IAM M-101]|nr:transposase, IS1 family [Leptolyngbya boryana IAM M-101]BAS66057.1 transposase, IS1 family [Leptolyngbya boryana dg5]